MTVKPLLAFIERRVFRKGKWSD